MNQEQILDADAGYAYAQQLTTQVAGRYGWTQDELDAALGDLEDAYGVADAADWWGADAATFWTSAYTLADAWDLPGADDLAATFASAAGTVHVVDENEVSAYDVVVEGATNTVEDLGAYAEDAADVATSRWTWAGLAGLGALGLLAYLAV